MKGRANIIKTILFFLVLWVLISGGNRLFVTNNRKYERSDTPQADRSEVIFAGTSQGATGINPQLLWDEFGIPAYNYCSPGQYIGITYYYLKDILEYQTPKVIVLDGESVARPEDFLTESNKLYSFTEIKNPRIRHQMYQAFFEGNPAYEVPLFRYHNRWKEISRQDFIEEKYALGAAVSHQVIQDFELKLGALEGEAQRPIGEREAYYLNQIADLAEEQGIPLVFLDLPCYDNEDSEALSLSGKKWAEDRGLSTCIMRSEEIINTLDLLPQDFADPWHLNVRGANKVTAGLGRWLVSHYDVGGHKGEAGYADWEARMAGPRTLVNSSLLMMEKEMLPYFEYLSKGQYTIILSLAGNSWDDSDQADQALAFLGIQAEPGTTGSWIVENGQIIFASNGAGDYRYTMSVGLNDITVRGSQNGQYIELFHGQSNLANIQNGLNLLVFSNVTGERLDAVGFDAENHYAMIR